MAPQPPRLARLLKRGFRLRCPLCGQGRLFKNLLVRHSTCSVCGLPFEREAGYFVGGMELHWITTYVLGVAGYFVFRSWLPVERGLSLLVYMPCVMVLSLLLYRYSRSLWMMIDNYLDPVDREYIELAHHVERRTGTEPREMSRRS